MKLWRSAVTVLLALPLVGTGLPTAPATVEAATIHVPRDQPTIQAAIDAATPGAVIEVAPGIYHEAPVIDGTPVTLASEFRRTGDPGAIAATVIDGGGANAVLTLRPAASGSEIVGFTIQNGNDGIDLRADAVIRHNRIHQTTDGIDSTNGSATIRDNLFDNNSDDGIDLDKASAALIENNILRDNGNDGIEIRLHEYSGPTLTITIRGNQISGSQEDGIQIIDYPDLSDRVIRIERNLIRTSTDVGIGLMDNGETREDYRGASIPERIYVLNNTIVDNPYGLTGGDNLIALNNIIANASVLGLKHVDGASVAAYNLFWNNAADVEHSNLDLAGTFEADPLLDSEGVPIVGSPAIDAGTSRYLHRDELVLDLAPESYAGAAPDLGWRDHPVTTPPLPSPEPSALPTLEPTVLPTDVPTAVPTPAAPAPVLIGAGDIAHCNRDGDEATAALLDQYPGTIFTTGDNVYSDGAPAEFADCYAPSWGRHKARTRPTPGNHDYHTLAAAGYFSYFGVAAGDPLRGYYSYELGDWLILALNSNCDQVGGCHTGSPQEQWLRAELAATPRVCTLAYWHHPLFSSGRHGADASVLPLWETLYAAGADVVIAGHDHNYERFAPQTPAGEADPTRGIRQFVIGTGGANLRPLEVPAANSEVFQDETHGLLELTLHPTSYEWRFLPVAGGTFSDAGSAACVNS